MTQEDQAAVLSEEIDRIAAELMEENPHLEDRDLRAVHSLALVYFLLHNAEEDCLHGGRFGVDTVAKLAALELRYLSELRLSPNARERGRKDDRPPSARGMPSLGAMRGEP